MASPVEMRERKGDESGGFEDGFDPIFVVDCDEGKVVGGMDLSATIRVTSRGVTTRHS